MGTTKKAAIIAMGNPFMSDEGIGIRVLERLREGVLPEDCDLLDLGTSGISVIHELRGRDKVVFIDCAMMGTPPGSIRRFTPDEVATRKAGRRLSLHEGDLLHTIALAERLGICPADVVIFGIEPKTIEPGDQLSAELCAAVDGYVAAIRAEL